MRFVRLALVLLLISFLFQVLIDRDELAKAGWQLTLLLRKLPISCAVALIAAGAIMIFQPPPKDDDGK